MEKETFWSNHASEFDEKTAYVIGKEDLELVKSEVGKLTDLGSLFEAACGSGIYTEILVESSDKILATDFSDDMIETSKARFASNPKIAVEKANIKELAYPEESFDTVFAGNILHVIDDLKKAFDNIYKLTKKGGRIITLDYTGADMPEEEIQKLFERFLNAFGKPTFEPENPSFTLDQMVELFESYNLTVEKAIVIGEKTKTILVVGRK